MYSIYRSARAGFKHELVESDFSTRSEAEVHIRDQLGPGYYVITETAEEERVVGFSEEPQYHLNRELELVVFDGFGFRSIE